MRVVQSTMQRVVRSAWAWHCRARFSEAIASARQLANGGLLAAGSAPVSEAERRWARAAAVWGAYLAVADDAHSQQDVVSEVSHLAPTHNTMPTSGRSAACGMMDVMASALAGP